MPRRYFALVVAAIAVLAVGMYLFHEVRATPATVQTPAVAVPSTAPAAPGHDEVKPDAAPVVAAVVPPDARGVDPLPPTAPLPPQLGSGSGSDAVRAAPKLEAEMDQANKAYDRGDFDEAKERAAKVLVQNPGNIRMLRILVSSACIDGDSAEAQKAYLQLPKPDREAMKVRCARYAISFNEQ